MNNDTIRITISQRAALALGALAIGAAFGGATLALADPSTSTIDDAPYVMPYEGFLELDGVPVDGSIDLEFSLYFNPVTTTPEWTEVQNGVRVHDGRFAVGLGATTPLKDLVLDAERLYIGIRILEQDGAGGVTAIDFDGRVAITPALQSAWVSNSANLQVDGDLTVVGSSTHTDDVSFVQQSTLDDDLTSTGSATINGSLDVAGGAVFGATAPMLMGAVDMSGGGVAAADNKLAIPVTNGNAEISAINGQEGVNIRETINPADGLSLFSIMSANGDERLRVEHNRDTHLFDDLTILRNTTLGDGLDTTYVSGPLVVTGDITNLTFSGEYTASADRTTSVTTMVPFGNSICFLVDVKFDDMEGDDTHECDVSDSSGNWRLEARSIGGAASCKARCFSW